MKQYNVAILESSPMLTEGLAKIIEDSLGFRLDKVFRSASNPQNLVLNSIDILIVNPRLLGENQIVKLMREWKETYEDLSIVALQTSYFSSQMAALFDAVIELDDDIPTIFGKLKKVIHQENSGEGNESFELSAREKDVLVAVAKGLQNKEIANQLNISVYTVMAHRKNITRKTGIKSIAGLTVYALLNNLISQNEIN